MHAINYKTILASAPGIVALKFCYVRSNRCGLAGINDDHCDSCCCYGDAKTLQ